MFVCIYALAVLQEEFVKKDGKDGFCRKCGLFCLYMVSRSFLAHFYGTIKNFYGTIKNSLF